MLERLADVDKFLEILPTISWAANIFFGVIFFFNLISDTAEPLK